MRELVRATETPGIAVLPAQSAADFKTKKTDNGLVIIGYTGAARNVAIPAEIDGVKVTEIGEIGEMAFYGNQLTGVTIPDTVTSIGGMAFAGNQLAGAIIPDGVTTIGEMAFAGNQLTRITIPHSVIAIGDNAFALNRLADVTIPNSVTTIGEKAFSYNQLTSATISNGVTTIGDEMFAYNQLVSVTIGANVEIAENAFDNAFAAFYHNNGKKAGDYTLTDGTWSYKAR
jgi:hypothetical protein